MSTITKEITKIITIKSVDKEEGILKATITTFGNTDKVGDIMDDKCLDKFMDDFKTDPDKNRVRLLFNHNRDVILGKFTKFEKTATGIEGTAKLSDTSSSRDVKELVKDGVLDSMSIGFRAKEYSMMEGEDDEGRPTHGVRFLEIELSEVSVVDSPANELATINSLKSVDEINPRELEKHFISQGLSGKLAKTLTAKCKVNLKSLRDEEINLRDEEDAIRIINNYKRK